MENQKANDSPVGKIVSIDGSLRSLVLQKFCYNDDGTIKAVIIDEVRSRKSGNTFYLCEFPNRERKWINSNLCWFTEKFVGISENVIIVEQKEAKKKRSDVTVVRSASLSGAWDDRFVVVDKETGEILDDAQGYGYKSKPKAYAAWTYKNRDKSKDKEKAAKKARIEQWMRKHKNFVAAMDEYCFEIEVKGSWGPDDRFNAKFVREMLKSSGLETDFTAGELLRVWERRKG